MTRTIYRMLALFVVSMLVADIVMAATITYVGNETTTGADWRTTTTSKTLDADGDDVYGTDGYDCWATGPPHGIFRNPADLDQSTRLSSLPSGLSVVTNGVQFSWARNNGTDPDFDDPTETPDGDVPDVQSGIIYRSDTASNTWAPMIKLVASQDIVGTMRLGVIFNGQGQADGVKVEQTAGGDTASDEFDGSNSGSIRYFFFDISDIQNGDEFTISIQGNNGGSNPFLMMSGLTFDAHPVVYEWTGAVNNQLNVAGNWLVDGSVPGAAPTDNGNQPKTPSIKDTLLFDDQDADWAQGPTTLYSFTGTRPWGSIEVRNGTVNFKGDANSKFNMSWSGTDTMVVGDGDTNVAAVLNAELINLNQTTQAGSSNNTKTYVVNRDGTLRNGQSASSVLTWSQDATQDTVMRIIGGTAIVDGYIEEAPLTGDAGDYVIFEEAGSTFTAGFGGATQFPDLAAVEAQMGDAKSFRAAAGLRLTAVDNGTTFTITAAPPAAGTLFVFY